MNVLSFLTSLYEQGLSYSSINTAKSALSGVLGYIDNNCIGKHSLTVKFMKGISRLRPPTAKYSVTWDADKVLDLFLSWPENGNLGVKELSIKLVSLLALTTAQRAQTLASICMENILWGVPTQIVIPSIQKCTSINRPNPVLIINEYLLESKLCVLACLREYVNRTSSYRNLNDRLFLAINKPHTRVTTQTVSRWLCECLSLAGVDTSVFKGHSFRHSATSKASKSGLHIDSIISRVGWSPKCSTFAKFYKRPIDDRGNFSEIVLRKT